MGGRCRTAKDEEALMKEWAAAASGGRASRPEEPDGGPDSADCMAAEWEAMLGAGDPGDGNSPDTAKNATRVLTADEIDSLLGFDDDEPGRRSLRAPTRLRRLDRDGEGARNEDEPGGDSGGEKEGEADGLERRRSEDVCAWLAALHMLLSIHVARLRSLLGFEGAGGKDGGWAGGSARLLAQEIPHAWFFSEEDREDAAKICAFALPERGFDEFDMAAEDRLHDAAEALGDMREKISWLLRPHEPHGRNLLKALDRAGEARADRIASVPEAARRFARAMAHPTKTVEGLFDAMKLSAHERLDILSCARTRACFGAEPDDDGEADSGRNRDAEGGDAADRRFLRFRIGSASCGRKTSTRPCPPWRRRLEKASCAWIAARSHRGSSIPPAISEAYPATRRKRSERPSRKGRDTWCSCISTMRIRTSGRRFSIGSPKASSWASGFPRTRRSS